MATKGDEITLYITAGPLLWPYEDSQFYYPLVFCVKKRCKEYTMYGNVICFTSYFSRKKLKDNRTVNPHRTAKIAGNSQLISAI